MHITNATARDIDGQAWVDVDADVSGCVVYGPYAELATGVFRVDFEVKAKGRGKVAIADIAINAGQKIVATAELHNGLNQVQFALPHNAVAEFRVHAIGKPISVKYDRPVSVMIDNAGDLHFLKIQGQIPEFVRQNYSQIRRLAELGVEFDITDTIDATVNGIRCKVHSAEELQLFTELFFINEYTFVSPVECVAIDIGMNVGLTSLLLASNPKVSAVHSYEPFATPYGRAVANIALNPTLAPKITTHQIGLADRSETVAVNVQDTNTVGVSIAGTTLGTPETISIAPAAATLAPIIAGAKASGQRVVMKVDCEGSEFAIFEDLERAGLFSQIDVMMIEWHKWWDKEKTQAHLVQPMIEGGLFVFDRTNPDNPMAGSLYAVRI